MKFFMNCQSYLYRRIDRRPGLGVVFFARFEPPPYLEKRGILSVCSRKAGGATNHNEGLTGSNTTIRKVQIGPRSRERLGPGRKRASL